MDASECAVLCVRCLIRHPAIDEQSLRQNCAQRIVVTPPASFVPLHSYANVAVTLNASEESLGDER